MEKPKFSLLTIFWLMLTACGFLAGRASTRQQLEQAEAMAINQQLAAERNLSRSESVTNRVQSHTELLNLLGRIGDMRLRRGHVLEVVDNQSFVFEEYDEELRHPVDKYMVELAGVTCPAKGDPFHEEGKRLLSELFTDFVIVLTPSAYADQKPQKSFVACRALSLQYGTRIAQFELIDRGFATADDNSPLALEMLKQRELMAKNRRAAVIESSAQPELGDEP